MKRQRVIIVAAAVFALCAIGIYILMQKGDAPPGPILIPKGDAPPGPASQAFPPAVTALDKAIDAVIAGEAPLQSMRMLVRSDEGETDLDLVGDGLVFIDGTQLRLTPEQLKDLLRIVRVSGFGAWEKSYGGPVQTPGRVRWGRRARQTLSMFLRLGKEKKQVRQLLGGEQFKGLPDLLKEIRAALAPLLPGGVQVGKLSRKEALEKIADGTLAPMALRVSVGVRIQASLLHPDSWSLTMLNRDKISVRVKGKSRRLALSRPECEAIARRVAGILAKADMDDLPFELQHPSTQISFSLHIRGQTGRVAAMTNKSPSSYSLKRTNPTVREKFFRAVDEIKKIHAELTNQEQQLSP
ncbi:hypothetical protein LCGC14_1681990 [marine sediment metagenome]|uniref:Uncharacterized protein n=1 Tax=marine sediment metagenome TaxID=412755 RepID=A0A0F9IAR8_9ZZZZ